MPVPAPSSAPVRKQSPRPGSEAPANAAKPAAKPSARPAPKPANKPAARPAPKRLTPAQAYDKAAAALSTRVAESARAVKAAIPGTREPARKSLHDALRALEDGRGSIEKTRSRVRAGYAALPKVSNWWAKISIEAAGIYLKDARRPDLAAPVNRILADLRKLQIPEPPVKK